MKTLLSLRKMSMTTILTFVLGLLLFAMNCNARPARNGAASVGNSGGAPPLVSGWTTFGDPAEQAFTLEVPEGWKITGGLYRFGLLDPRLMVDMVSPDGKINIRFGDYRVPPFAPLTPTLASLGFTEGRRYTPRNVAQEVIANYRPGWVFADVYGQARFSGGCTRLNLKSMNKQSPLHESGPNTMTTAGDVLYTCESSSGPKVAYVFAETQYTQMQQTGVWMVIWLYSFIAPKDQADEALKTTLHALSTFVISPQWYYRQLQINGQVSADTMNDFHRNMDAIQQDYQRRSAASQSQFDQMDRALRGVDLTTDPVDGKQREVLSTGQTHWINGLDQIIDSPTAPSGTRKLNTNQ